MTGLTESINTYINRFHYARLIKASLAGPKPKTFTSYPEPTDPGDYSRGLRLLSGDFFHEQEIIRSPEESFWDIHHTSSLFMQRLHAMDWMDDLAAVNTNEATRRIQKWAFEWMERYGRGEKFPWRPEIVGWRVIRLITHATLILNNAERNQPERFFDTLGAQTHFLRKSLDKCPEGLPRFVALTGWLFAALALDCFEDDREEIVQAIDNQADGLIYNGQAELASRNPEELSQIFCLLVWADHALAEHDIQIGREHEKAIDIIGQALRSLRLGDRGLVRAHGGGAGNISALERALSLSQVQGSSEAATVMGFAPYRVAGLATVMDCAPPPSGKDFAGAQASTLGIWVSDNQQMIIGSKGWSVSQALASRIICQETQASSTLVINDRSSSTLIPPDHFSGEAAKGAYLEEPADVFDFGFEEDADTTSISATHDGYRKKYGLTHNRQLSFDRDGDFFAGIDVLSADTTKDKKRLRAELNKSRDEGLPFSIHFHLGANIKPSIDMDGEAVSFSSRNGRLWIFRQKGGVFEINNSQYYEEGRIHPIATKSIVIHSRIVDMSGYISWSFQAFDN